MVCLIVFLPLEDWAARFAAPGDRIACRLRLPRLGDWGRAFPDG